MDKTLLVFAVFVEGFAVMMLEIAAPKLMAPIFGSSMYVWSSVIGVSVGALAAGYYTGGLLSKRYSSYLLVFVLFLFCSVYVFILPSTVGSLKDILFTLDVKSGSLLLAVLLLLPILLAFGALSPLIIQIMTNHFGDRGYTGLIYGISTTGGFCACPLGAFLIIPFLGLDVTFYIVASLLLLVAILILIRTVRFHSN